MLLLESATMPTRTGLVALLLNTGVRAMVHAVPSQCSARVLRLPAAPTAQTSFEIELIAIDKFNETHERTLRSDMKYRFVIDIASLR